MNHRIGVLKKDVKNGQTSSVLHHVQTDLPPMKNTFSCTIKSQLKRRAILSTIQLTFHGSLKNDPNNERIKLNCDTYIQINDSSHIVQDWRKKIKILEKYNIYQQRSIRIIFEHFHLRDNHVRRTLKREP